MLTWQRAFTTQAELQQDLGLFHPFISKSADP